MRTHPPTVPTRLPLAALLALGLVACGTGRGSKDSADSADPGGSTSPPELSLLTSEGGCGDLFLYQVDPAGSLLLEAALFVEPSLGQQSADSDNAPVSLAVDLAETPVVTLSEGIDLHHLPCNDALNGTEEVRTEWAAVSGTATFTFTASGEEEVDRPLGQGRVALDSVVVEAPDGTQLSIPDRSWEAAAGWLPG